MTGIVYVDMTEFQVNERELYATVVLARSGDLSGTASVNWATNSGTATAGSDFALSAGTATFAARAAKVSVTIPILDDQLPEPSERFTLSILSVDATSSILFPRTATITIADDENPVEPVTAEPLVPAYAVRSEEVGSGFRQPITMTFIGGTERALVAEKAGIIKLFDLATGAPPTRLMDLRAKANNKADRGLLDIVLHPDLAHFPYLYAFYVVDPPDAATGKGGAARDGDGNRFVYLSRFTLDFSQGTPTVVPDSEALLLGAAGQSLADISGGGAQNFSDVKFAGLPASNEAAAGGYKRDYLKIDSSTHAGGGLAFGPDGMLYVGTGDGSAFDFADRRATGAQDPDSLSGKILRIDPVTGRGLADNPFTDGDLDSNRSKVWSRGLRNPYTIAFTPEGRLFVSETGWDSWEEINVATRGSNHGWPFYEGGDGGKSLPATGYEDMPAAKALYAAVASGTAGVSPAYRAFSHVDADPGFQVSGIVGARSIYTGDRYPPAFHDAYFFTDIVDGELYAVSTDDPAKLEYVTDVGAYGPTGMVQGPDGYMYLMDMVNDRILRLVIDAPLKAAPAP